MFFSTVPLKFATLCRVHLVYLCRYAFFLYSVSIRGSRLVCVVSAIQACEWFIVIIGIVTFVVLGGFG